jgi:hypothetical protein
VTGALAAPGASRQLLPRAELELALRGGDARDGDERHREQGGASAAAENEVGARDALHVCLRMRVSRSTGVAHPAYVDLPDCAKGEAGKSVEPAPWPAAAERRRNKCGGAARRALGAAGRWPERLSDQGRTPNWMAFEKPTPKPSGWLGSRIHH